MSDESFGGPEGIEAVLGEGLWKPLLEQGSHGVPVDLVLPGAVGVERLRCHCVLLKSSPERIILVLQAYLRPSSGVLRLGDLLVDMPSVNKPLCAACAARCRMAVAVRTLEGKDACCVRCSVDRFQASSEGTSARTAEIEARA